VGTEEDGAKKEQRERGEPDTYGGSGERLSLRAAGARLTVLRRALGSGTRVRTEEASPGLLHAEQ